MQAVFISPKSWHYRLQEFVYGQVPYRYHFCPYFWLTIAAMFFFPFIFLFRGVRFVAGKLLDLVATPLEAVAYKFESMATTRKERKAHFRLVTAQQWFEENITDEYEAFRFYHWFRDDVRRVLDFELIPKPDDKQKRFYKAVWDVCKDSDLYKNCILDIEDSWHGAANKDYFVYDKKDPVHKMWTAFRLRLNEEYEERYVAPVLLAEEEAEAERQEHNRRVAARQAFFSKLAVYTKYPFYAVTFIGVLLLAGTSCYGLYLLSGLVAGNIMQALIGLAVIVGIIAAIVIIGSNIAGILVGDDDFASWPLPAKVVAFPMRYLVRSLGANFVDNVVRPGLERIEDFLAPRLAAAWERVCSAFSIFGTFLHSMYEGACPNMAIDGDDTNENHRLDGL